MYKVDFYTLPNGRSPANEFVSTSEPRLRRKIFRQIKYLEEFGLSSENHYLRKLTGTPLWEIRILGGDSVRLVCVALIKKRVVILHIFKKKSNKTPPAEIKISLKRYMDLTKYI